jgi:DNA-binding YbaB/EbfC family protein
MSGAGDPGDEPVAEPAGLDLGALFEQAMDMQQHLIEAQAAVVEGRAGGGAVTVRVNGAMEFEAVSIAPEALDPPDAELLGDLVLAALRDAVEQINQIQRSSMGGLDLGGLGGLDLGELGGALGLSGVTDTTAIEAGASEPSRDDPEET